MYYQGTKDLNVQALCSIATETGHPHDSKNECESMCSRTKFGETELLKSCDSEHHK